MTDPAAFYASVHRTGTVPGRKVFQIVLEGPIEDYMKALQVIGNLNPAESTWLAIARLDPSKVQPVAKEVVKTTNSPSMAQPASATLPGRASPQKRLVQLAGMLAKTPLFHKWIEANSVFGNINEDSAAQFIRNFCRVESRSHIIPDTPAGEKFIVLYDRFVRWRDADQYVEAS